MCNLAINMPKFGSFGSSGDKLATPSTEKNEPSIFNANLSERGK